MAAATSKTKTFEGCHRIVGCVCAGLCAMGLAPIFSNVHTHPCPSVDRIRAQFGATIGLMNFLAPAHVSRIAVQPAHLRLASYSVGGFSGELLSDVKPPTIKNIVSASYPNELRESQVSGLVAIEVTVAPDGTVSNLSPVSGNRELTRAAVHAVSLWTFNPATKDGVPIQSDLLVKVRFVLADSKSVDPLSADLIIGTEDRPAALSKVERPPDPADTVKVPFREAEQLIVSKTQPVYPENAKRAGLTGQVVLALLLDKSGNIARLDYIGGPAMLKDAAMTCVRQWTFRPYLRDGQPQNASLPLVITFP